MYIIQDNIIQKLKADLDEAKKTNSTKTSNNANGGTKKSNKILKAKNKKINALEDQLYLKTQECDKLAASHEEILKKLKEQEEESSNNIQALQTSNNKLQQELELKTIELEEAQSNCSTYYESESGKILKVMTNYSQSLVVVVAVVLFTNMYVL